MFAAGTQVRLLKPEEIKDMPEERCFSNTTGLHARAWEGGGDYYSLMPSLIGRIESYDEQTGRYSVRFTHSSIDLLPAEFTPIIPLQEGGPF